MTETRTREELITEFHPQVVKWVVGFVKKNSNFDQSKDDLISCATIKLIETIDRFFAEKRKFNAHFQHYLRISVCTAISDFARDNSVIRAPKETFVNCEQLSSHPLTYDPPFRERSVEADLFTACDDHVDAEIIQALYDGKSRRQIAKERGEPYMRVWRRVEAIKKRFEKLDK